MKSLRIDVWSDIACPWCYVGKRHLESALARFPHRERVRVVWRAFELDPTPTRAEGSHAELLARKYGMTTAAARSRLQSMTEMGAKDGIDFRFDRSHPSNTFDGHRVLHLALDRGVQDAMKERLMRAYFTDGERVADRDVLVRVASEAGLPADDVRAMLASESYSAEVRADENEARDLAITGVPFFVIGRYGLSGAQPADTMLRAIEKAWGETPEHTDDAVPDGAACGADGCN